ncbi:MAG TPA: 50S ribosomal protein L10, partial [Candidatus Paceibacterota bacterium]
TKTQKKEIIDKVGDIIKDSKTIVFVNFHGLKVDDTVLVRRKLRSDGIGFFVAKKTLTEKAISNGQNSKKISGDMPELAGELGLVYGKDLIAPAREIFSFQTKLKNSISILGGIFDNRFMSKQEMMDIALIPEEKTLRAMFVNVINSPIQGFVMALSEISKKRSLEN